MLLQLTFGGMCSWRRVAVARVFALVVRCRIMMLICLFSRWQKPWHQEGVPRGSGARPHSAMVFARRLQPLSRADKAPTGFGVLICRISAQKPAAPMTYTDLLAVGLFIIIWKVSPIIFITSGWAGRLFTQTLHLICQRNNICVMCQTAQGRPCFYGIILIIINPMFYVWSKFYFVTHRWYDGEQSHLLQFTVI